jgi:hypothetical protein
VRCCESGNEPLVFRIIRGVVLECLRDFSLRMRVLGGVTVLSVPGVSHDRFAAFFGVRPYSMECYVRESLTVRTVRADISIVVSA